MLAKRYLKPPKTNKFQLFITILSIGGVMVGVSTLIAVVSVMNGLHTDIKKKIVGVNAHIIVTQGISSPDTSLKEIKAAIASDDILTKEITGISPFVISKVMIRKKNAIDGVLLRGYDMASGRQVSDIEEKIIEGAFLADPVNENVIPVVIGNMLAENLEVETGDVIEIFSVLSSTITPVGPVPKIYKGEVVGVIDAGLYEYNSSWIFVRLEDAQKIVKLEGKVTGFQIAVKDMMEVRRISKRLQDKLGFSYSVQDWLVLNKNLFAALKLEKTAMTLILFMIIIVAAFNIVSTLIMIVIQKTREIGILRSIGLTRFDVMRIFVLQGTIMGFVGTALGILVGLAICFALGRYEFPIDTDVYVISSLPITVNPIDVVVISLCSLGISFLSAIYPAYRASRLLPVEALRYE